MLSQISGERGQLVQAGHQKSLGLQPKTEEAQAEEEMRHFLRGGVSSEHQDVERTVLHINPANPVAPSDCSA